MTNAIDTLIKPHKLASFLSAPDWIIFDCRFSLGDTESGRREHHQAHIPGARYLHLDEDLSGKIVAGKTGRHPLPSIDILTERFSNWGIDDNMKVIAYDDAGGAIAARMWWMLRWLGHDAVAVLDGGWSAWVAAGLPVDRTVKEQPSRKFNARPRGSWLADAAEVERSRLDQAFRVIDSRGAARFRGEHEPIDPVAGHIPGASNLPFLENQENGRIQSTKDVRARFENALGGVSPENTIFYCGSGVTAAYNLLAMKHAGLGDGRLYAGSWSDWITDKARPVATGSDPESGH